MYCAIRLFTETGAVNDRERSKRPRSIRTENAVKAVAARIRRYPVREQKVVAREMKFSLRSRGRIIKSDLRFGAYRKHTGHLLTESLKKKKTRKIEDAPSLLRGQQAQTDYFYGKKIFTIEEHYNKQNDKVYAHNSREASEIIPRFKKGIILLQ